MGVLGVLKVLGAWLVMLVAGLLTIASMQLPGTVDIEFPERCQNPPLAPNQTGLKVLVAGLAKSGTRSITHALNDIGIRTHHSEDFHFMPMWAWMTGEWAKRGTNLKTESPGALIRSYPNGGEALAQEVSKCGVEGIALDGVERFYEPLLDMSPGVKVIHLNWRSFESQQKSGARFMPKLKVMCQLNLYSSGSLWLVPWGRLLRVLDPLVGSPMASRLQEGGPPFTEVGGPLVQLAHQQYSFRRQYTAWEYHPLTTDLDIWVNKDAFHAHHDTWAKSVPPERYMLFNFKKNTFEELCKFMEVSPCPRSGLIPRAINTWIWERDFPISGIISYTVRFFFHWVNWRLFCGLFSFIRGFCVKDEKKKTQ